MDQDPKNTEKYVNKILVKVTLGLYVSQCHFAIGPCTYDRTLKAEEQALQRVQHVSAGPTYVNGSNLCNGSPQGSLGNLGFFFQYFPDFVFYVLGYWNLILLLEIKKTF